MTVLSVGINFICKIFLKIILPYCKVVVSIETFAIRFEESPLIIKVKSSGTRNIGNAENGRIVIEVA